MTTQTITSTLDARAMRSASDPRPATVAAARLWRATAAVGVLGIVTALFVSSRVFESWRVVRSTHTISLLGRHLSYPAANAAAIAVLALALLGAMVTAAAIRAAIRELRAARRFGAMLARSTIRTHAGARLIERAEPHAFCAGLLRPRVYISTGALEQLDEAALTAVLDHERHHAMRRDPLKLAAGRVLSRSLFFLPWLRVMAERERALAELSADESATAGGDRAALARAMLAFEQSGGIDPERVDRLLGIADPPAWRFPTALVLAALAVSLLLFGIATLGARVASGTATLAPPLLSRQPCVIMLALVPAAVAFLGFRAAGRMRSAWLAASSPDGFRARRSSG